MSAPDSEPVTHPPAAIRSAVDCAASPSEADVASAFAAVPLIGTQEAIAERCVEVARTLTGRARIALPPAPVPRAFGDAPDEMEVLFRFDAIGGEAEFWAPAGVLSAAVADALCRQLERVWSVQREQDGRRMEVDTLRFHLSALQQVTHTLAEVGDAQETDRLSVDSVKEVFFAWWAVLYKPVKGERFVAKMSRTMRGERINTVIPFAAVSGVLAAAGGAPVVLPPEHGVRELFPPDMAVMVPVHLGDAGTGFLALGPRMTGAEYDRQDLALLRALAETSAIAMRNADLVDRLRTQAMRDALTGCQNRRGFDERLSIEVARSRRYGRTFSLVLLDIDHFKTINDEFGHEAGDHTLRRIGDLLVTSFRSTDSACRLGGEEFALIFPETPKVEGGRLAERIRASIATMIPDDVMPRHFTASFGIAAYPEDAQDMEGLLRAADRALYRAKSEGRNRVAVAGA